MSGELECYLTVHFGNIIAGQIRHELFSPHKAIIPQELN